jgi:hypothetical protein
MSVTAARSNSTQSLSTQTPKHLDLGSANLETTIALEAPFEIPSLGFWLEVIVMHR